jgi:hypothetical protein
VEASLAVNAARTAFKCSARHGTVMDDAMSCSPSMTVARLPQTWAGWRRAGIRARLRRFRLDIALAHGADPWSTPELMVRASRLSSLSERRTLAAGLLELVSVAEHKRRSSPYIDIRHHVVLEQRESLLALAERLGRPAPVNVAVVAEIAVLLCDPSSPVYEGGKRPQGLAVVTARCLQSLD